MKQEQYIGRFAPSPTGPLHYGSLVAAAASYLQAKHNQGKWLVRIEDIDPPREVKGATEDILNTLECYKFEWNQEPLYQSTRFENYRFTLNNLIQKQLIYACSCTRKELAENVQKSDLGKRYPGICSNKNLNITDTNFNLRLRVTDTEISFKDQHYGIQSHNLSKEIGDVVIYRKNNLPSYSLAVTVDDAMQNITEVVRGIDLLAFTPLQIYLCKQLQIPAPNFLHVPIIANQQGQKLSKQNGAKAIPKHDCSIVLVQALKDLGQAIPAEFSKKSLHQIWKWAIENWDVNKISSVKKIISSS